MKVQEIMTTRPICVGPDEPVSAAARLLSRYNLGAVPVCDQKGRLRGMVTDRDIALRCVAMGNSPAVKVSEIMSRNITAVEAAESVESAARRMSERQVRRLPVTEGGRLVGMLTLCDLARREDLRMECAEALGAISAGIHREEHKESH